MLSLINSLDKASGLPYILNTEHTSFQLEQIGTCIIDFQLGYAKPEEKVVYKVCRDSPHTHILAHQNEVASEMQIF